MKKTISKLCKVVFTFVIVSSMIYFGISALLIVVGKPIKFDQIRCGTAFDELFFDDSTLPELNSFKARDGTKLPYRYYPAKSDKVLILLHGSGGHSRYFLPLAESISAEGLAQVYTPDLRGHGIAPERRGDVDYIGQLEDDLVDLIAIIRKDNPNSMLIVGGHSSGGGLAVRFAGSPYGRQPDAYVLLAPFLKYNAPTMRPGSGGWALPYIGRIVGLKMLNNAGVHWFDYLTVMEFNLPEELRNGDETPYYSHRLNTGYAPRNYKKDLRAITQPLLLVAGTADEIFIAEQFESVISQYTSAQVRLLPGVTHIGLVVSPELRPVVRDWLKGLGKP